MARLESSFKLAHLLLTIALRQETDTRCRLLAYSLVLGVLAGVAAAWRHVLTRT